MPAPYCDAHNHWQDEWLAPYREAWETLRPDLQVGPAAVNATHPGDWPAVAALAAARPWVHPQFGVHPWYTADLPADWLEQLREYLRLHPRAGLGEIGLDRWILESARPSDLTVPRASAAPLERQRAILRAQLDLAAELGRTVTLHCLQAWGALREELVQAPRRPRAFLIHAYGGPPEMVRDFLRLGARLSFNACFLQPRKATAREVFRTLPADRLLVETDAPALAPPEPWRRIPVPDSPEGRTVNHPGNLPAAYEALAQLRGQPLAELRDSAAAVFAELFPREPPADLPATPHFGLVAPRPPDP